MTTGSEGDGNQDANPGDGGETKDAPTDVETSAVPPKSFTQEEVNRFNTKAKRDGEKAEAEKFAKRFGMSYDDAEKVIQEAKAKQDAEKSELDKLREANETLQKESEANTTKLQKEHHTDRVKLQLTRAGFALPEGEEEADKALDRLVGLVSVEVGASPEDIRANIEELKEQFPNLVAKPDEQKPAGNPSSNPSGTPRKPAVNAQSPADVGEKIAAQHNAKRGVTAPA